MKTFAFYWKNDTTTSGGTRIRGKDLAFGTQGGSDTGNPTQNFGRDDDMFFVPAMLLIRLQTFVMPIHLQTTRSLGCLERSQMAMAIGSITKQCLLLTALKTAKPMRLRCVV